MNDESPLASASLGDAEDRSLREDLRQLAADARTLAEAELAYQKSRAAYAGNEAKILAILGALASALAFFSLMALVLGSVIALSPTLGPWGATAAVAGGLVFVALVCLATIRFRIARMKAVLSDEKPD